MPQVCKAETIYYVAHYRTCLLIPVICNGLWENWSSLSVLFLPKVLFIRPNAVGGLNHYFYVLEFGSFGSPPSAILFVTSPLNVTPSTAHIPLPPTSGFGISSFAKRKRLGPLILHNSFQSRVAQAISVKGIPTRSAHKLFIFILCTCT